MSATCAAAVAYDMPDAVVAATAATGPVAGSGPTPPFVCSRNAIVRFFSIRQGGRKTSPSSCRWRRLVSSSEHASITMRIISATWRATMSRTDERTRSSLAAAANMSSCLASSTTRLASSDSSPVIARASDAAPCEDADDTLPDDGASVTVPPRTRSPPGAAPPWVALRARLSRGACSALALGAELPRSRAAPVMTAREDRLARREPDAEPALPPTPRTDDEGGDGVSDDIDKLFTEDGRAF
mmetsp:Transcript_471/g.1426  ORF Transcript_471/g.1426 Transcript_471/m.1426 type:complete len:242 (+) Transcript_471:1621-2346(+)